MSKFLLKLVTVKFVQTVALILLRYLVDRSENTLDNELLEAVEEALKG